MAVKVIEKDRDNATKQIKEAVYLECFNHPIIITLFGLFEARHSQKLLNFKHRISIDMSKLLFFIFIFYITNF